MLSCNRELHNQSQLIIPKTEFIIIIISLLLLLHIINFFIMRCNCCSNLSVFLIVCKLKIKINDIMRNTCYYFP